MRMYLLDKKQRVKRWLKDNDFLEAEMTEEINAANQINFSTPLKDRIADNIYYVAIPTPRSKQKYLLFKLLSERVKNDRIEYQGIEEAYDELKQYGYIKDIRPNDRTAEEMLKMVLEPTRWTLGNVPETNHQSTNFYYITYLEALQKIVGLFNIELTFEVTIDPKSNKITRRQVNVYTEQGQRTGKCFEYGSNLLTVQQEQDSQELITALVGRGKGELVSEGYDDTPDGYGRRITFADVVWTKKDGHPVDKPAGQEYLVDPEATALYGFSDGNPRIGLTVFEDIEDPVELINATWRALQSLKRPKVSFKADVTDVGQLGLGDTVAIIRHDLKIEYFTRVYKVKHNLLNENDNQIELGDDFSGHSITSSLIKVDEIANEARETAGHAAIAANGKNNNYYSSVQPLAPVEGDIWYKDLGNGETDMYQYHNGGWVFIQSTRDLHVVENQVKEAQQGLNQAEADIINNKQKADADIENLNKSIEANKKVADESLQKLNDSVTNLQGQYDNNFVPNLNKVMADASDALRKYISAQNSIADLTKQAQEQGKDIADVTNTVKGLNINYANLAGDVNSTKVDVKGLQTTVGTVNGDIVQLKLDAQNLQTMLAGKVDNTTYTNFVNLTNQALNVRLTASDLNGYAKTADVQATVNGLKFNIDSVTDRMNNLKVGGRNLIPNSGTDIVIESKTTDPYPAWDNKAVYWDLTPGETYTFSVSATNTNGVEQASVRIFKESLDGKFINKEAAHWYFNADGKRRNFTFTTPNDAIPYDIWLYAGPMGTLQGKDFTTTYHHPQLEVGTVATDYRPAPEDVANDITQLSARITANSQQFSSYYTKSETNTKTNIAKNDAVNAIKSDSNWTGLKNVLTNSGFLQTADGFLQKVQQTTIPMFNGGGVNLLKGTADFRPDNLWQPLNAWVRTNETYNGLTIFKGKTTEDWNGLCQYYPVKSGETYTFSLNARYESGTGRSAFYIRLNSSQEGQYKAADTTPWSLDINLNENWQRYSITFKASSDGYIKPRIERGDKNKNILEICGFKLEQGSVATPWSPNPADVATQSAFSELSQTLQGLRSTVSGNYGQLQNTISQTNQATRNELINKITGVENKTTSTANSLNSVIGRIGSLEHLTSVQVVNNAINANDYTTTGTYFVQSTSSSNVPATNWFYLEVQKADNGRIAQVWQADSNPTLRFVRTKIGDSWSNWQRSASYSEYSELSRTVSGLQSTVSGNYNTLTNQITQTNQTTRNEITDKVAGLQNQITANANSFNVSLSKIQQTDGINLLKGTRDFTGDWVQRNDWTRDGWVDPNGNYAVKRKGAWSGVFQRKWLETGTYIFSVYYYLEASDSNTVAWVYVSPNDDKTIQVTENSSATLEIRNNGWIKKTYIFTVTKPGTSALRVETNSSTATIHVGSYKLERGSTATPWTPNPQDIYMNPNVATKIYTSAQDLNNLKTEGNYVIKATNNPNSPISNWLVVQVDGTGDRLHQTISADNDPNLSYTRTFNGSWSAWQRTVTGGNIMAQINMSAGATLIQNNKIYMDASSTIFSGNAFIPSAAITSLNADKITAGTINGAKVNVINLNANNITAGTLKGSNGEFYLDSGALHVWQNNHDAWIDQNGIHDYDNQGNNVWIKKGCISAYGNTSSVDIRDGEIHLNKKMWVTDNVLASDYGTIAKADNVFNLGTSGLALTGTDGFLLKTSNWNDGTLTRMGNDPINGSGIAGNNSGFMQLAAGKQLFLYAGPMNPSGGFRNLPHLVLDGTVGNEKTELFGYFSSYNLTSLAGPLDGGLNLEDDAVMLKSLNGKNGFSANANGVSMGAGDHRLSLGGLFSGVNGDFSVVGNFTVTGSKNAVVPTSRGMAAINAYETAEYYFGDIGETQTNSNGVVTVMIDPYFLETVNTLVPYQVFLTSYGDGNVWVSSRSANNFTVKSSKPNIHFAWEIKAKRKGYENDRMKIVKGVFNNEQY